MKPYSSFILTGQAWNHHAGKITLSYSLDNDISFEEMILLPERVRSERLKEREWEIERTLNALHLIGGISYYKTCLPRSIKIPEQSLSKADAAFWTAVYERGLGEFFYRNNIDFRGLIKFPIESKVVRNEQEKKLKNKADGGKPLQEQRLLVPIGGGKDSLVTIELLKASGANITLLRMGSHPLIDELGHLTGLPMLTIKRSLSGNLFDLNEEGALNGHVPITAYLSILSVFVAEVYGFDAVVMSNERSANEGNITFKGMDINHQWSKSIEFERAFRRYLHDTIGTRVEYFSLLRPFSELKIAEMFSRSPKYFMHATSCNTNWKIQKTNSPLSFSCEAGESGPPQADRERKGEEPGMWCKQCPKCAFVFACMSAFLPKETLEKMFGGNLFQHDWLLPLYRELLGIEKFKPFECVGTPDETKAAFLLAMKRGELSDTPVMKMFMKEVLPTIKDPEALIASVMTSNDQHCIPQSFETILHSTF